MGRPHVVWAAGIGSLVVLDVVLDRRHDGSTLSEVTRLVYRTETRLGRYAFVASWVALSGWLIPHICRDTGLSGPGHDREQVLKDQTVRVPTSARG